MMKPQDKKIKDYVTRFRRNKERANDTYLKTSQLRVEQKSYENNALRNLDRIIELMNEGFIMFDSNGINYQERKIVIKRVRSLFDQKEDVLYPYITYYNEKGQEKTERLVKTDKIIRAIFVKQDDTEIKGKYHDFMELTAEANEAGELKQIRTAYTYNIYNWYERVVKQSSTFPKEYFPRPILIRKYIRAPYEELPALTRDYYEIVALDKEPRLLGE